MSSLDTYRTHAAILFAAAVLTLSVRAALTERYAAERKVLNREASLSRTRELVAAWNGLSYTAAQESFAEQMLPRLVWPAEGLTVEQVAALKLRLLETLTYLQHPQLGGYARLKTNSLRWEFTVSSALTNEFAAAIGTAKEPAKVMERLWEAIRPPEGTERPRLTAVNLDRSTLATSRTNSRMAIVNGPTRKGLTVLRVAPEPSFRYAAPHTSSEGGGPDELYAHLSFYARSNTSTNAGPVYLSFAWSEPDQRWVLAG